MTESSKTSPVSGGKAARLGRDNLTAAGPTKTADNPADNPADDPARSDDQANSLQAFVETNEAIMTGMATLGAEMVTFGSQRLCANLERSESLAACNDLTQVVQIQSDFIEAATRQYQAQTNMVLSIMTAMSRGLWAPLPMPSLAVPPRPEREAD